MTTKKYSYPPINMGTSFLAVMFIILCMVIFAILSFSSAVKDSHSSEKNALRTTAYYEACNAAEKQIGELVASGSTEYDVQFSVPINDSGELQVTLDLHPNEQTHYTITSWQIISHDDWKASQTLPVLGSK